MIPYNPSSFNSNKTILEQILEIKKWLIAHPSYKVYYCTSNFMPTGDDDRAFTEIAGTEEEVQNIAVGDLLVFPDAYYSEVIAVDLDNELVTIALPATNFSGPQGATGPSGADGTNGTCIRYCNTNKNSNPSTTYAVSDITFSTGLQINDCILFKNNRIGFVDYISGGTFRVTQNIIIDGKDGQYVDTATINSDGDLIITLYDPESMIQSSINVGHVVGADGNNGVSITNVAIDGNQHLIVTLSDGNTIDAGSVSSGSFDHYVVVTGTSGTLTTAEYNKLLYNDSVVIRDASPYISCYQKYYENSAELWFARVINTDGIERIVVNKTTKAYNRDYQGLRSGAIDSQTATNGQVLTADGSGGASWQTPSGSFDSYITLTSISGTLTQAQYDKITPQNSIIKYNNELYIKTEEVSGSMTFRNLHSIYDINDAKYYTDYNKIVVIKSTHNYTISANILLPISKRNIKSESATNGQVLTADGNGGASWQNAGGGSGKYLINVTLQYGVSDYKRMRIYFQIVHTSSSFTDINEIITALNDQGYNDNTHYITAVGSIETGINTGIFNNVCACGLISTQLYAKITHNDQSPTNEVITAPLSSINVYQNSIQL